jgi:hypothetical protein
MTARVGLRSQVKLTKGHGRRRGMSRERFLKLCFAAMAGLSLLGLVGCGGGQDGGEGGGGNGNGKKDKEDDGGGGGY